MSAYDDAAEIYLMGDIWTIPVLGHDHTPIAGATGYTGTVTVEKIMRWLDPDPMVRAKAGRGNALSNTGIRHDLTLAIDVDEGYGNKNGVAQLAEYAEKRGLPPLPGTWSSTARGPDTGSRQYVYTIDENVKLKTKPCKSVEVCNWHHRFTVCAPSIHPRTGQQYTWYLPGEAGVPPTWGEATTRYPRRDFFTKLPIEWVQAFKGGVVNADRAALTVELPELVATFAAGEPDGLISYLLRKWEAEHVGHDEFKNAMLNALILGRQGHVGVPELVELLIDRFTGYVDTARPHDAEREVKSLIEFTVTIAQQKPINTTSIEPGELGQVRLLSGVQMPTIVHLPQAEMVLPDGAATYDELRYFLDTYTRYARPTRLAHRITWAKAAPAGQQGYHFRQLIAGALAGDFPASRVLPAIREIHQHHGGAADPRYILCVALGAILNEKASA